jgi:hypothetical protein
MRTTIYVNDDLLISAKRRALENGRTLTAFIEDALRAALAGGKSRRKASPGRIITFRGKGLCPGVDLDDNADLLDAMEN